MFRNYDRAVCYLVFFLFFTPLYLALPAMQEYIIMRRCRTLHGSEIRCDASDVNGSAAEWNTWVMLACNIPTLFASIPIGRLADRYGRKRVLVFNTATQCVGSLGMLLVCLLDLDLFWYMPLYFVNGLGGGSYVLILIILASLIDSAEGESDRTAVVGNGTALIYLFGAIGPVAGGYLEEIGEVFPCCQSDGDTTPGDTCTCCSWCHGKQYQLAFLQFFGANCLLLLVACFGFRETLTVEAMEREQVL
jgi:MFS family permease